MGKEGNFNFYLNELIQKRWSPRSFADRKIENDKLLSILEAGRWAPSSYNEQPWRFIVGKIDEGTTHSKILDCLVEGNQSWAKNAPILILTNAKLTFSRNDNPNKHSYHDVGLAAAQMAIQAAEFDIYFHQMAGFSKYKAIEHFNIPENYEPVTVIAVGYLGNPENLKDEKLLKSEKAVRKRKSLSEIVFTDEWNRSADFTL